MTPEVEFVRRERAMVASLVDSLLLCFGMVVVVDLGSSIFDVVKSVVVDSAAVAGGDCGGGMIVVGMVCSVVDVGMFGGVVEEEEEEDDAVVSVVGGSGRVPVVGTRSRDGGGVGVLVAVGPSSCSR
jgi:hypothetical protein